ncbi:hypothetical protein E2C01_050069 [Portunus trituberculatus]|uniref:Uncharacterized protein n=1 Tax=Portunus trituberculatus TaxID=210409 RepID=A0A5B7GEW7_PORTR|nr:hypothetical protein [Portunus trituberculatus]
MSGDELGRSTWLGLLMSPAAVFDQCGVTELTFHLLLHPPAISLPPAGTNPPTDDTQHCQEMDQVSSGWRSFKKFIEVGECC